MAGMVRSNLPENRRRNIARDHQNRGSETAMGVHGASNFAIVSWQPPSLPRLIIAPDTVVRPTADGQDASRMKPVMKLRLLLEKCAILLKHKARGTAMVKFNPLHCR